MSQQWYRREERVSSHAEIPCNQKTAILWSGRNHTDNFYEHILEGVRQLRGEGEVYSFTVIRQSVGCPVESVKLGMKVAVQFEKASDRVWLPKFKPA